MSLRTFLLLTRTLGVYVTCSAMVTGKTYPHKDQCLMAMMTCIANELAGSQSADNGQT